MDEEKKDEEIEEISEEVKEENNVTEETETESENVEVDDEPTKVIEEKNESVNTEDNHDETVSVEEYHEMKKSRNHIIYALLIIIIAFGVYITYNEFIKNKKDVNNTETREEQKEQKEEKKEEPVSNKVDTNVDKEIVKKLQTLFASTGDEIKNDKLFLAYNPTIPIKMILTNTLTEEGKELIALQNTKGTEIKNNDPENSDSQEKSVTDYRNEYKYLFGAEPQKMVSLTGCPAYRYEKENNRFVLHGGCGFVGGMFHMIYIDKVTITDSNAVIKTYIGSFLDNATGNEEDNQVYSQVLYDYDEENKIKPLYDKMTFIDAENKTKFTPYNFIFTKLTDGKYYFSKTEKAS